MCWVSSEELWRSRRVLSASAPTHDPLNQYFWKFYEGDSIGCNFGMVPFYFKSEMGADVQ